MRVIQTILTFCVMSQPVAVHLAADESDARVAPPVNERQLPLEMHSKMEQRRSITVGNRDAVLVGSDDRVHPL